MTLSFKSFKLKAALTIFKNKVRLIYGLNIMIGIVGLWAITMTLIIEYIEPSPHWFIALLVGLLPLSIIKIYKTDLEGKPILKVNSTT